MHTLHHIKQIPRRNNPHNANRCKNCKQLRFYGLRQHNKARKAQSRYRHHKTQNNAQCRTFEQKCLRNRYAAEDVRVHGNSAQNRNQNAKRIFTPQSRSNPPLRNPVVNERTECNACKNIRKKLFQSFKHFVKGRFYALFHRKSHLRKFRLPAVSAVSCIQNKIRNFPLKMKPLNQRTASHRNHKPEYNIQNGSFPPEYAHQNHKRTQIHHRRRNQKTERNSKRKPSRRKSHKNRNGRTRAERSYSPKQSSDNPRTKTAEPPHNLPALLRRKKRLNQRNQKNQHTQKHRNLDDVKQKKRHSPANFRFHTQPGRCHTTPNKRIQPLHPQNFVLKKIPHNLLLYSFYFCSGGFLVASVPSTGSGTKATKNQAVRPSASMRSILAATFHRIKILLKLAKSFAVYRIVHPLTVAPCIYKTTFTKNFYMMRKCGLRYVKLFQNPARTKFTASQKPDYFKPVFIAQRPANSCSFFYGHNFTCFKNILIFINV